MLIASSKFNDAFNSPGRELYCRMIFNDRNFDTTTIKEVALDDDLVTGEVFEIGTFITTSGTCTILDTDYNFADKEFELQFGILLDDNTVEYLTVGFFRVETSKKNEYFTELKFYDRATRFDTKYNSNLKYPATLREIVLDVCNSLSVELSTTDFINNSHVVELKPNFTEDLTYRKVIAQIAELAGGYARITSNNKLEFFNLSKVSSGIYTGDSIYASDTNTDILSDTCLIGLNRDNYISLNVNEQITETISKVVVKVGEVKAEMGDSSGRTYYIENNIFCQNPLKVITPIFDKLYSVSYRALDTKWIGNPIWQTGDKLTVHDGYKLVNTYIMSKTLKFNGGLTEEYKAVGKTKEEGEGNYKGNLTLKVEQAIVEIKVNKDSIEQRVTQEEYESFVTQTAHMISQKVSNDEYESYVTQTEKELKSRVSRGEDLKTEVTQNADSWELSIKGKLNGKKYKFDGNGFLIGGTEGDVAFHSPTKSEWTFADGSICRIDKNGFYQLVGSSKREYFNLTEARTIELGASDFSSDGRKTMQITLPSEFRGKKFIPLAFIDDMWLIGDAIIPARKGIWVSSINQTAGTFTVEIRCLAKKLGGRVENGFTYYGYPGSETGYYPCSVQISYIVFA